MKSYKITLCVGFAKQTRFVEAENEERAIKIAIGLVRLNTNQVNNWNGSYFVNSIEEVA